MKSLNESSSSLHSASNPHLKSPNVHQHHVLASTVQHGSHDTSNYHTSHNISLNPTIVETLNLQYLLRSMVASCIIFRLNSYPQSILHPVPSADTPLPHASAAACLSSITAIPVYSVTLQASVSCPTSQSIVLSTINPYRTGPSSTVFIYLFLVSPRITTASDYRFSTVQHLHGTA